MTDVTFLHNKSHILELELEVILQLFSPDLASKEYHFFWTLPNLLEGKIFETDDKMDAVSDFFNKKPVEFTPKLFITLDIVGSRCFKTTRITLLIIMFLHFILASYIINPKNFQEKLCFQSIILLNLLKNGKKKSHSWFTFIVYVFGGFCWIFFLLFL